MYVKVTNNTPEKYTLSQLFRDHPQVSFPSSIPDVTLAVYDVYPLRPATPPEVNPLAEKVVEGTPIQVNGEWVQKWDIVTLTQPEADAAKAAFIQSFVDATQKRLDDFARSRQYDGILSLCTYATDSNPKFATEGAYGLQMRSETWGALYTMLLEVEAGERDIPGSFEDIESELPELVWPI